ncbi:MAG: radical SAM protein, partial [Deltaproteobacteria bacterium]|nr:radical SAM protein [Deltaproteobacteria bacterium]
LVLEQQYRCNLRCPMCILGQKERLYKPAAELMSDELFFKIMEEARAHDCPSISMNNTEEPLLNKKWLERIEAAREYGFIDIMMNTNATLLDGQTAEKLVDSGLTRLLIGLDAVKKETYEQVRVGADFDEVIGNIKRFLRIRKEKKSHLPVLRLSFVVTDLNRGEADDFVAEWVDEVDYLAIQEYIPVPLGDQPQAVKGQRRPEPRVYDCDQPFNRMTIRPDGQVLPCCSWFGYQMPIGDAHSASLHELWHSTAMNELRHQFRDGVVNSICRKCLS